MKTEFKLSLLASALLLAGYSMQTYAAKTTDIGTIKIVGDYELGGGQIEEETGTKTRSSVSHSAIKKASPSSNAFQLLNNLPSVNVSVTDGTGLFGGSFHMRGFGADQVGFTINGAPVNDSGNFAVYPSEYTDKENLCNVFVTQGSVDTEAPHVGATGGNIGMVTCDAKDEAGGRFSQSFGQQNYRKTFLRGDSGYLGPVKFFISYSKQEADTFIGPGNSKHDHIDFGGQWNLTDNTTFKTSLLYNKQVTGGYNFFNKKSDYEKGTQKINSNKAPRHDGSTDSDWEFSQTPYWKNTLNPFENYLWTASLSSRINDKLTLEAKPYFWYGYGSGGYQATLLDVSNAFDGSKLGGGIKNPYIGSGIANTETNTRIGVWRSSLTETNRPGITLQAKYNLDRHKIMTGVWYEHADHRQTKPATMVDNNGNPLDKWQKNNLVHLWDGSLYQGRNQKTITDAVNLFFNDDILLSEQWTLQPGLRYMHVKRQFDLKTAFHGNPAPTSNSKTYNELLPSLGATFQANENWQIYGNIAKNARIPQNYTLGKIAKATSFVDGKPEGLSYFTPPNLEPETSINTEAGLRFNNDFGTLSLGFYNVNYKNRLMSSKDLATGNSISVNAGETNLRGLELQAGTKPINGFSFFGSLSYSDTEFKDELYVYDKNSKSLVSLNAKGNEAPLTPEWMASFGAQYAYGPFYLNLVGKYTGEQYTNITNKETVDPYTVWNLSSAYQFNSAGILKTPTIQLNIVNLFDKKYIYAGGWKVDGNAGFNQGAPRFASITFSTDF